MVARADTASLAVPRERSLAPRLLLVLPLLGALIYPALTAGLYASGRWASAHPSLISYLVVLAGLLAVFSVPFYGFVAAYRIGRLAAPTVGEHFMRVLYHLVAASPPLFGAFGMASVMLGSSYGDYVAWFVVWTAIAVYAYDRTVDSRPFIPRVLARPALRVSHGTSAAILILIFIAAHLGNHMTAIWSLDAHSMILKTLRLWYRTEFVEPLIVTLLLFQAVSGLTLLLARLGEQSDLYRVIQTVTGTYLAVYIPAHITAVFVLGRWFYGIDTGTGFVFLKHGYFPSLFNIRFIAHYWLAAFAVITHAGSGLRNILLAHHASCVIANRTLVAVAITGFVVATTIALALCGVHLAS
jgi:hypothetical protein